MKKDVEVTNDSIIVGLPPMTVSTGEVIVTQANTNYFTDGASRGTQCCSCDK